MRGLTDAFLFPLVHLVKTFARLHKQLLVLPAMRFSRLFVPVGIAWAVSSKHFANTIGLLRVCIVACLLCVQDLVAVTRDDLVELVTDRLDQVKVVESI